MAIVDPLSYRRPGLLTNQAVEKKRKKKKIQFEIILKSTTYLTVME